MHPLPHTPRTFRDIVEADLRRGARLIIKVQDELDPQFRLACPDGDYALAVTLSKDDYERRTMLRRISSLMVWKQASAFTMVSELVEPDCAFCIGVSRSERLGCLARITRIPKPWTAANFGAVQWLGEAQLDPLVVGMLPLVPTPLTPKVVSSLNKWFGADGTFPLVHLPTGEVPGV